MANEPQSSRCIICQESFVPDPRVGARQKACRRLSCQQQRKRRSQTAWLSANPGYFKGRYPQLKEQILANQKKARTKLKTAHHDIQDELSSNNNNILNLFDKTATIQDELKFVITTIKEQISFNQTMIYKTS